MDLYATCEPLKKMPVQEGTLDMVRVCNYSRGQEECDSVGPVFVERCVIHPLLCQWNLECEPLSLCLDLKHILRVGTWPSSSILVLFPRLSCPAIGSLPP